ncbi:hypothetical protein [Natrinema marinum]|uniref:hypothetical protein n=1 Tax=Natrinema marinum TaxID=2961598 RepID=UPI0020C86B45|nr:hypothetical protein [Natrinema marinum]
MVTGAIGPALAAPGGSTAEPAVGDDGLNGAYQLFAAGERDPAALELKYAAVAEFAAIRPADRRDERLKERVGKRLNETLDLYLDKDRVESHMVFEGDAAAVSRMAPLADADPAAVNESTWLLAKANARTANVSITDTRRALERFEDDIDNPGHRNAIESHLRNAERAYDRGEKALEDDGGNNVERTARERARAIRQFMTAWRQSQQALDKLERQTTPRLRITTRNDPVRNGSDVTNRTIGGAIEAVGPNDLGNVTVTVEGGSSVEVQPGNSTVPASNVTFVANVSFEDRDQRIRAALADNTNRKQRRGPPKHANGRSSPDSSPTTDELLLDGDALPDTYELERAGTDPLAHDSDSAKTAVDESDNGTIDGLEELPRMGVYSRDVLDEFGGVAAMFGSPPWYTASLEDGKTVVIESDTPWLDGGWRPPTEAAYLDDATFNESDEPAPDERRGLKDPFAALETGDIGTDLCVPRGEIAPEFSNEDLELVRVRVDENRSLRRIDTDSFVRNIVDDDPGDDAAFMMAMLADVPADATEDTLMVSALLRDAIPPAFVRLDDSSGETVVSRVVALESGINKVELLVSLGRVAREAGFAADDIREIEQLLEELETLEDTVDLDRYLRDRLL